MTKVKVIIKDGIVTDVLADGPVDVEVVEINPNYEDYDKLRAYDENLHKDKNLKEVPFMFADFR